MVLAQEQTAYWEDNLGHGVEVACCKEGLGHGVKRKRAGLCLERK